MQRIKVLKKRLIFFIIEFPVFLLLMPRGMKNIFLSAILFILFLFVICFVNRKTPEWNKTLIKYPLPTIIIDAGLSLLFYQRWSFSNAVKNITGYINLSPQHSLLMVSVILAIFSVFGIDYIINIILFRLDKRDIIDLNIKHSFFYKTAFIFLTALITITLNSECSPLYPFNTWDDPNFMMTVGKSVLKGFVPYRDLYEQKGPLLLFIHTAGAAISFDDFTGIWIIEIFFCFLFLFLSYKIVEIFFPEQGITLLPILAALIFSRWAFQTGDTAEEFCLPFLTFAILFSCKTIQKHFFPEKNVFFILGLTIGCVFWIKYSMIGFYVGWGLFFITYSFIKKQFTEFLKKSVWIITGFFTVSLPILIYFIANQSLSFLFESYFYNVIFIYAKSETNLIQNLAAGFEYLRLGNMFSIIMFLSGIIWFILHKQHVTAAFLITTFTSLFFFIFFSDKRYIYYGMIFSIFSLFGLFWPIELLKTIRKRQIFATNTDSLFLTWSILFGAFVLCCCSRNMVFLDKQKKDLMQYRIKEIIELSGINDPGILEYKTAATGVNTVAGLVPKIRFFCSFNINLDEMEKEQKECFEERCTDFVIIQTKESYDFEEYPQYIHLGGFEGNIHDTKRPYFYHLYQRKESL